MIFGISFFGKGCWLECLWKVQVRSFLDSEMELAMMQDGSCCKSAVDSSENFKKGPSCVEELEWVTFVEDIRKYPSP